MNRPRLFVGGVFAGFAVLALLVVLVFQFGRHDPSPPSLQDNPNPAIPGEVIYLAQNSCVTRIDASGANRREIVCPGRADFMARLDDRTIVYGSYGPAGPLATQRDLVTGQETAYPAGTTPEKLTAVYSSAEQRSVSGEYITVDPNGSVYRSNGAEPARTLIFECDCSKYRVPQFYSWAPDGQWVILVYTPNNGSEQELWILARDGSVAGTLASVGYNANASWYIEGKGILPKSQLTPVAR